MLSKKETKLKQKLWISKAILTSIKIKNILYRKYLQKQDIFWYERYKFYRNKINKLISKSKKSYLRKFFQDNFQNFGGSWKKFNQFLNKKPNKNDDIIIKENGGIICNQKVPSNKFNNYFVNVAQNLLRELGEPKNKFQVYLKDHNTHSFFLKERTPTEVQKLLNNTNTRKASDIYGISPKLVKLSFEHIKNVHYRYLLLLLVMVLLLTS